MKNLKKLLKKHSGRSAGGMITVRSQGGRHKRYYREIDFKRNKFGVLGEVVGLEYDPNRNVEIALIKYKDGEFRYILSPKELKLGDKVVSDDKAEIKVQQPQEPDLVPMDQLTDKEYTEAING